MPTSNEDVNQCFKDAFIEVREALDTTIVASASANGTNLDWEQVIKLVFDQATKTFKVVGV